MKRPASGHNVVLFILKLLEFVLVFQVTFVVGKMRNGLVNPNKGCAANVEKALGITVSMV